MEQPIRFQHQQSQDHYPFALSSTMKMASHSPSPESCICPQDVTKSEDSEDVSDIMTVKSGTASQSLADCGEPSKKKRKSWGQVLPKPTTNLPPRKRAKTEEEKAQRKYERVQRNRHAAHMSRMRKQDEMEQLKHENDVLKQDNESLNQEIARLREALISHPTSNTTSTFASPPQHFEPFSTPDLTTSPSESSVDFDNAVDVGFAGAASNKGGGDNVNLGLGLNGTDHTNFSIDDLINFDGLADNSANTGAANCANNACNTAGHAMAMPSQPLNLDNLNGTFDFNGANALHLPSEQFHLMSTN